MEKMTPAILNLAYSARRNGDCKELFLNSLLQTYVYKNKDIKKDQASLVFLGKCTMPKAIVCFYAAGASLCPPKLYSDVVEYFQNIENRNARTLEEGLYEVLRTLPEEDAEEILKVVTKCERKNGKIYTLLVCLMFYAWRCDLAQYTYSDC